MEMAFFIKKLVSNGRGYFRVIIASKSISRAPICLSWMTILFRQKNSVFVREFISGDNNNASNKKVLHLEEINLFICCAEKSYF